MKMSVVLFAMLMLFGIVQSCSPSIKTNLATEKPLSLDVNEEVLVLDIGEAVPNNSNYIGELKIGANGFTTDCTHEAVMKTAKKTAKQSGANLIVLSQLKDPNLSSNCYRIKGKMYKNTDEALLSQLRLENESKNQSRLSEEEDYAVIHFYRPKRYKGALQQYKIRVEDDIIGKVGNGKKFEYKVKKSGKLKIWAKTEANTYLEIDVKKGEEYFVRCGLKMGVALFRPKLDLMENKVGIAEYAAMN